MQWENKIVALIFHLGVHTEHVECALSESEMLQVLDTFKDLSIKDRNQIQNEHRNVGNGRFEVGIQ